MSAALAFDIVPHAFGEILNADLIRLRRLFAPVPGGGFAHKADFSQRFHYGVLNEIEILPGRFPLVAVVLTERVPKFLIASRSGKPVFQIGQLRNRAAESPHFVEHFQKYVDNRVPALFAVGFAFGVDVEQNHVRRGIGGQFHIR